MATSSSLSSVSVEEDEPAYKGPFVGRARVIRDYTPSPYDREALTLKVRFKEKIHGATDCLNDVS